MATLKSSLPDRPICADRGRRMWNMLSSVAIAARNFLFAVDATEAIVIAQIFADIADMRPKEKLRAENMP